MREYRAGFFNAITEVAILNVLDVIPNKGEWECGP